MERDGPRDNALRTNDGLTHKGVGGLINESPPIEIASPHPKLGWIGISASSGGLRCACYLGALQSLLKYNILPHIKHIFSVSGSSGTFAPVAAARNSKEFIEGIEYAQKKWKEIFDSGGKIIFDFPGSAWSMPFKRNIHFFGNGFLDNDPLYWIFDSFDPTRLVDAKTIVSKFEFGVFNHGTRNYETMTPKDVMFNPEMGGDPQKIVDALVASKSISFLFPPVLINGTLYSDGDYRRIVPLIASGCDTILLLHCHPKNFRGRGEFNRLPPNIRYHFEKVDAIRHFMDIAELDNAKLVIELIKARINSRQESNENLEQRVKKVARGLKKRVVGLLTGELPQNLPEKAPRLVEVYIENLSPTLHSTHTRPEDFSVVDEYESEMDRVLEQLLT